MAEIVIEDGEEFSSSRRIVDENNTITVTFQTTNVEFKNVESIQNKTNEKTQLAVITIMEDETSEFKGSNESLKITAKKTEKCKFFMLPMGCRFGDSCKFVHYRAVGDAGCLETENNQEIKNTEDVVNTEEKVVCITETQLEHDVRIENNEKKLEIMTEENKYEPKKKTKLCYYYNRGNCKKGNDCPFTHELRENKRNWKEKNEIIENNMSTAKEDSNSQQVKQKRCIYFLKGGCRFGENCRDLHETPASNNAENLDTNLNAEELDKYNGNNIHSDNNADVDIQQNQNLLNEEKMQESSKVTQAKTSKKEKKPKNEIRCRFDNPYSRCRNPKCKFLHLFKQKAGDKPIFKSLRQIEFEQLEKRLKNKFAKIDNTDKTIYRITLEPTDPDWNFVVTSFDLKVEFPSNYPKEMFNVELEEGINFPEGFASLINKDIENWCEVTRSTRNESDLSFRPFLRWFDNNILDMFISAATKVKLSQDEERTGIHFTHHTDIISKSSAIKTNNLNGHNEDSLNNFENTYEDSPNNSEHVVEISNEEEDQSQKKEQIDTSVDDEMRKIRKGTEIKFKNLQLSENVGTLELMKVELVIECSRCKNQDTVKFQAKKAYTAVCGKCSNNQELVYHPVLMHQHGSVAGYLHLNGCKPVDLLTMNSVLETSCLECSTKQELKGLSCGDKKITWCVHCHVKMVIVVDAIRFLYLQPGVVSSGNKIHLQTQKKKIFKDPNIKDGEPLPDFGICKHYKKSFRWLRFPCCGKTYPCDKCHDSKEDHYVEYANKMICGYCAKEQNFTPVKPCIRCLSDLTRQKSSHWEGGKGCRDRTIMAKSDRQKTAGLNKTISRKKVTQDKPKEKKAQSK